MESMDPDHSNTRHPDNQSPNLTRSRLFLFSIAMLLTSVLVALVASEFFIRAFVSFQPPVSIGSDVLDPRDHETAFEADPVLIWRLRKNVRFPEDHAVFPGIVSNSQRLRSAVEIPAKKTANELRILFVGDSVTFGWGVPHEATYSELTGRALQERFPDLSVTIINAGVPAYGTLQGLRFLEAEGFDYQPDLVVVGSFGFTDSLPWEGIPETERFRRWDAEQANPRLQWSYTARLISRFLYAREYPPSPTPDRPRLNLVEFRDVLERIREATQQHGAQLLVLIPPHMNNLNGRVTPGTLGPQQQVLADFGETLHLGLINEPALVDGAGLLFEMTDEHDSSKLMIDLVHPTEFYHAAFAAEVDSAIAPWVELEVSFGRFDTEAD
jgi:hypothetical protein